MRQNGYRTDIIRHSYSHTHINPDANEECNFTGILITACDGYDVGPLKSHLDFNQTFHVAAVGPGKRHSTRQRLRRNFSGSWEEKWHGKGMDNPLALL